MINIGRYKDKVSFYNQTQTTNEFNDIETMNVLVFLRSARCINITQKANDTSTPTTDAYIEIRTRYSPLITDNQLVEHKGFMYEVLTVIDYEFTKKELVIQAKKVM